MLAAVVMDVVIWGLIAFCRFLWDRIDADTDHASVIALHVMIAMMCFSAAAILFFGTAYRLGMMVLTLYP